MFTVKPISKEGIPDALDKAERYRWLNEPLLAESICRDILKVDPDNKKAIITLLLALTDQFATRSEINLKLAQQTLQQITDEYEKDYYEGIICERQGRALLDRVLPGVEFTAYEWLTDAMEHYEKAEKIHPKGNDDAILRWNTCVRLITRHHLKPRPEERVEHPLDY